MAPTLKLWYFDFPGKAEITRLILNYGGVKFEDVAFTPDKWEGIKPTTPFGQVPVLEVDGKQLAQSTAIERYAAKLAGIVPSDELEAAKADEALAFAQELLDSVYGTYSIKDEEAKIKARQELCAGPLKDKCRVLVRLLESSGGEYLCGSKPTYADFVLFKALSLLVGGTVDGVPSDTILSPFPALKVHHSRVANLPAVAKMYANVKEGPRLAYKARGVPGLQ